MINLDFSGVTSREPLVNGVYVLTLEQIEETVAQNSGNPMLKATFAVDGLPNKLFDNFVLTPKALWKLKEYLEALGFVVTPETVMELDVTTLVGMSVQAKVIQEEYEGNMVNRIKKFFPMA